MNPDEMEVGAVYVLRDGHKLQRYRKVDRREYKYEGEAPGPEPTGWFLDTDNRSFHAFRLSDVVEKSASKKGRKTRGKGRKVEG